MRDHHTGPGALISLEGINGVGKDHLLTELRRTHPDLSFTVVHEFSQRRDDTLPSLDRHIIRALATGRDYFLRGGHPQTETLLLLSVKMHDYEHARPALEAGHLVVEGRGLHTVAIYQAAIVHHNNDDALAEAISLLELATEWRPLPHLTVLVIDNLDTAIQRIEARDGTRLTHEQRGVLTRASWLYQKLAAHPRFGMTVLDRRKLSTPDSLAQLGSWITHSRPAQTG